LKLFEDAFGLDKVIQATTDSGIALLAHDLFISFIRFFASFNSVAGVFCVFLMKPCKAMAISEPP
jgi:hypothetical protein